MLHLNRATKERETVNCDVFQVQHCGEMWELELGSCSGLMIRMLFVYLTLLCFIDALDHLYNSTRGYTHIVFNKTNVGRVWDIIFSFYRR